MKDRAESAKAYIESKYQKLNKDESNRKQAFDILHHKMQKLNLSGPEQELIKQDILHKEAELNRKMRKKISTRDFDPLSIIGRGAFGEVRICRHIESGEVVAVKRMKKAEMINKNQVNHIKAEREVLVKAKNPWIVDLKYSFQDDKYLYLVMDFLPGGDLMTLLMRKDILTEDESRFYIA
jgi:serine/threonine kinase 38